MRPYDLLSLHQDLHQQFAALEFVAQAIVQYPVHCRAPAIDAHDMVSGNEKLTNR
jgi:hypothetical protein